MAAARAGTICSLSTAGKMADPKILERIDKLMRVAAPGSGATDSERANAALEAARLVSKHGVQFHDSDSLREHTQKETQVRHGVWVQTIALQHCNCSHCNKQISREDHAWVRIVEGRAQFRHNYGSCRPGH